MTDQQGRDFVCILLIGTVVVLCAMGHVIPPVLQEWADTAFGFLFGAKSATYFIGKKGSQSTTTAIIDDQEKTS